MIAKGTGGESLVMKTVHFSGDDAFNLMASADMARDLDQGSPGINPHHLHPTADPQNRQLFFLGILQNPRFRIFSFGIIPRIPTTREDRGRHPNLDEPFL